MSDLLAHETIAPDDAHGETDATAPELDALFAKRTSTRKAVARLALALVSLGIVAAVIVAALPSGLLAQLTTLMTPPARVTPSPTSPPFHTQVWITSDVRFGTLTLNGKRLPGPPPQAVALRNGDNTVILDAPPFPARKCTVRGPLTISPNGDLISGSIDNGINTPFCMLGVSSGPTNEATVVISIQLSGDDLAPAMRASALDAVNRVLTTIPARTTTVPAGQYFASGVDQRGLPISRLAAEPLTATVDLLLVDPGAPQTPSGGYTCPNRLCSGADDLPDASGVPATTTVPVWNVAVPVVVRWRFSTASGAGFGAAAFQAAQPLQLGLVYDSTSGWQVGIPSGSPYTSLIKYLGFQQNGVMDPCGQGMQMASLAFGPNMTVGFRASTDGASTDALQGCALTALNAKGDAQGQFIWRFGALLAADTGAHALLPTLPMAPIQEIKAVGAFGG